MSVKRERHIEPGLGMVTLTVVVVSVLLIMMYNSTLRLGWAFWISVLLGLILVAAAGLMHRSYQLLRTRYEAEWRAARVIEEERDTLREEKEKREAALRKAEQDATERERIKGSVIKELQGDSEEELTARYFQIAGREWELAQGMVYQREGQEDRFSLGATYAYASVEKPIESFALGESLTGQTIANGEALYIEDIPDDFSIIVSGLGRSVPSRLLIVPFGGGEEEVWGAFELAFFRALSNDERVLIEAFTRAYATRLAKLRSAKE